MDEIIINIALDFSPTPGPRKREEGQFSAEEFLESTLIKNYDKARSELKKLIINLDGTAGYATSFLEGSFGELVRLKTKREVIETLIFISNDEPYLIDEIKQYMENA
jgi:hypothetical protein